MIMTEWMVGIVTLIVMIPIIWEVVYLKKIYQDKVRNAIISDSDDLARTKQGKIRKAKRSDSKKNFWNLIQILFMSLLEAGIILCPFFIGDENLDRAPPIILWWMAWHYILTSKKTVTWKVIALILSMGILGCSAYESTSLIMTLICLFGTPVFWIVFLRKSSFFWTFFVGKRSDLAIKIERQNKEKLNQIRQKKEWIKTWKQPVHYFLIILFFTGILPIFIGFLSSIFPLYWGARGYLLWLLYLWLYFGWFLFVAFYAIYGLVCQFLCPKYAFDKEVLEDRKTFLLNTSIFVWSVWSYIEIYGLLFCLYFLG